MSPSSSRFEISKRTFCIEAIDLPFRGANHFWGVFFFSEYQKSSTASIEIKFKHHIKRFWKERRDLWL